MREERKKREKEDEYRPPFVVFGKAGLPAFRELQVISTCGTNAQMPRKRGPRSRNGMIVLKRSQRRWRYVYEQPHNKPNNVFRDRRCVAPAVLPQHVEAISSRAQRSSGQICHG
jgi:hypothetical protein